MSIQRAVAATTLMASLVAFGTGCETKSFIDPSEMGRYEKTPKAIPILDKLVIGVEADEVTYPNAREVSDADLQVNPVDYRVGPGDLVQVTIQNLSDTGLQQLETKRVSESGKISLPYVSQLPVAGLTEPEIEEAVKKAYADAQILTSATVSVAVVESQNRIYTVYGAATQTGPFPLLRSDLRLMEALANARGVTSELGIDYVYVIRRKGDAAAAPGNTTTPVRPSSPAVDPLAPTSGVRTDRPLFLIAQASPPASVEEERRRANDLVNSLNRDAAAADPLAAAPTTTPAPAARRAGVSDRVIQIEGAGTRPADGSAAAPRVTTIPPTASVSPTVAQPPVSDATPMTGPGSTEDPTGNAGVASQSGGFTGFTAPSEPTDREVIRVPYPALRDGSLKYNIVIRPQDLIYIPSPGVGEYYMGGHVVRPGVYSLTARKITLKQAVISAGMLDQLAIPARTDVIRRTGANQEVFVRVDLERIFSGLEPDIYLRPNDIVQVGTNAGAPFLAALRNAFRITYGFGFLYDRNFSPDDNNNN